MGDSIARMVNEARRKSAKDGYWCDGGLHDLTSFLSYYDEYNSETGRTENRLLSALAKEERNSKKSNNQSHHKHRRNNHNNHNNHNTSSHNNNNHSNRRVIDVTPHSEKAGKLKRALLELLK